MKTVISPRYTDHTSWIASLPGRLEQGDGNVIYDKRNKLVRFSNGIITVVVKRYKIPNLAQRIFYTFFGKTKAAKAFAFAEEYRKRGIATPAEVAYMESSKHGLFYKGYFVSLAVDGIDPRPVLEQQPQPKLLAIMAKQIQRLHLAGIIHGDLNLSNMMLLPDGRLEMIDINRSTFRKTPIIDRNQCLDNLTRLTHIRPLYSALLSEYAKLQKWNAEAFVADGLNRLDNFEAKKARKKQIKKWLHLKV